MLRVLALVAVGFGLVSLPGSAHATTTHDMRGTFTIDVCPGQVSGTCTVNNYPQTWTFATEDLASGAISGSGMGTGSNNKGQSFTISGTISGDALSLTNVEGSYSSHVTATINSDSNSFSGTYTDSNHGAGVVTATRTSGPPPPPTPTPTSTPNTCTNATTSLVTCPEPNGSPGVCSASGTIFPQCNLPTNLPMVCGPSGTSLPTCQSPANYVVACGGLGTSLPQCNLPPAQIPQVCGPPGTGLPICTNANNPITVCGPTGSGLAACSFTSTVNAVPINVNQGTGEVNTTLSCPTKATVTQATRSTAHAAAEPECDFALTLTALRDVKRQTMYRVAHADGESSTTLRDAGSLPEGLTTGQAQKILSQNAPIFEQEANRFVDLWLPAADELKVLQNPQPEATEMRAILRGDNGNQIHYHGADSGLLYHSNAGNAAFDFVSKLVAANQEYRELVQRERDQAKKASVASVAAVLQSVAIARPLLVRHVKVRRGRRVHVRIKLPRSVIRTIARQAGRARVLPLRIVVSYSAKPLPVARIVDIAPRIRR